MFNGGFTFLPHLLGDLLFVPRPFLGDRCAATSDHEPHTTGEAGHHDHHHHEHTNADQVETFLNVRCDPDPLRTGKWNRDRPATTERARTSTTTHRQVDAALSSENGPAARVFRSFAVPALKQTRACAGESALARHYATFAIFASS
ncbi:hypothetical protein [Nocardia gipuzkoensis]